MKLDYLFTRHESGFSWRDRKEPRFASMSRAVVPADEENVGRRESDDRKESEAAPPIPPAAQTRCDPRRMSPRQLGDWAHDMYLAGALSWEDYCLVGFPAELHPDYNRTVGALTGRMAQPDAPRDMVEDWEERLAFTLRHHNPLAIEVRRVERVLSLLRRQASARAAAPPRGPGSWSGLRAARQ